MIIFHDVCKQISTRVELYIVYMHFIRSSNFRSSQKLSLKSTTRKKCLSLPLTLQKPSQHQLMDLTELRLTHLRESLLVGLLRTGPTGEVPALFSDGKTVFQNGGSLYTATRDTQIHTKWQNLAKEKSASKSQGEIKSLINPLRIVSSVKLKNHQMNLQRQRPQWSVISSAFDST